MMMAQCPRPTVSDLGNLLELSVDKHTELPAFDSDSSVYIPDAMGIIQATDVSQLHTFRHVTHDYMKWLLVGFKKCDTLVDVFDRYTDNSVKTMERER